MLWIVKLSYTHYVSASSEYYNFYWHSGGGAHHIFLTTSPEKLIQSIAKNSLQFPNMQRLLRKNYGDISEQNALEYFKKKASISEAPHEPEKFFELLKQFIELDWRWSDKNTIEIATPKPGKIIGKGGRNIREIRRHLSKNIKVTKAWTIFYNNAGGKDSLYIDSKPFCSLEPEEIAIIRPFHTKNSGQCTNVVT